MIPPKSYHRVMLSLIGVIVIVLTWMQAVPHLYQLPPAAMASFTTITVNAQYVIGAIIIFMVTGRLVYEWKSNMTSQIIEHAQQIREDITEKRTPAAKHFDDETL
jgi:uncharacterized membrane protein YcjF (UPF0283 family)